MYILPSIPDHNCKCSKLEDYFFLHIESTKILKKCKGFSYQEMYSAFH